MGTHLQSRADGHRPVRLRHGFGESLALAALQRYLRRRDAAPAELLRLASMFDVAGPVRRALDVATAE